MFCLAAQVMALVPYNEESIPVLYKPQRQFSFLGHALTIAQDWGRHGVAAVVWDAVRQCFFHVIVLD